MTRSSEWSQGRAPTVGGEVPAQSPPPEEVRLQPVPELEWSWATEDQLPSSADGPAGRHEPRPVDVRRGWIHTASEHRVVRLYRELRAAERELPAPWWLRALAGGRLSSRTAAFEFEDQVHDLLARRGGWVFVPWAVYGETGYWEYAPSDREPVKVPTTVLCTDEHSGWLNVLPAHSEYEPAPIPVKQLEGLLSVLPRIESW